MKKLLIVLLFLGIAGTALASDACERLKSGWRICTGEFQGVVFYVTVPVDCAKAYDWLWNNFETLEKARQDKDMRNASDYAVCQTDLRYRIKRKALQEMNWQEVK